MLKTLQGEQVFPKNSGAQTEFCQNLVASRKNHGPQGFVPVRKKQLEDEEWYLSLVDIFWQLGFSPSFIF